MRMWQNEGSSHEEATGNAVTLNQALALIKARKVGGGEKKPHYLICGFEPLHLKTFLRAHLLERLPGCDVEILNGVYGDLSGNLIAAAQSSALGAAIILEWSDIDPRLGLRSSGGWAEDVKPDIIASAAQRLSHIETALTRLAARMPVAVVPPCLPMIPMGNTVRAQASIVELELEQQLASFLLRSSRVSGVRIVERSRLDKISKDERLDVRTELMAGFPYTTAFADALAAAVTDILYQPAPKKGLITDLDDTLWSGIVGEVGADGVTWQQESHTQPHGLYQQMLGHLASCGVLLAVCSKNELSNAEAALARTDLFLKPESFFPVCANWEPKSKSVARILQAWNIGHDSVVFIDDSPMELDEVRQAFPGITCLEFPKKDPAKLWHLLGELRDLFGKPVVMDEDRLRQASIRASATLQEMGDSAASPEFLSSLGGTVTLDWRIEAADKRPLELINKTNQFNLNGHRISEGEYQRHLEAGNAVLAVVSYSDRFGPLGKVAVVLGTRAQDTVKVTHWVMSCRAFSRRLEHHTLDALFRETKAGEIEFALETTGKNKPLQEFFRVAGIDPDADGIYRLTRNSFSGSFSGEGTALPHQVVDLTK
jgi:FkbH-like protein